MNNKQDKKLAWQEQVRQDLEAVCHIEGERKRIQNRVTKGKIKSWLKERELYLAKTGFILITFYIHSSMFYSSHIPFSKSLFLILFSTYITTLGAFSSIDIFQRIYSVITRDTIEEERYLLYMPPPKAFQSQKKQVF